MKYYLFLFSLVFTVVSLSCAGQRRADKWHLTGNSNATARLKLGIINSQPVMTYLKNAEPKEHLKVGPAANFTFYNNGVLLQQSSDPLSMGSVNPNAPFVLDVNSTTQGILLFQMP